MSGKKPYAGSCIRHPFPNVEILCDVVDNAIEITRDTFIKRAFVGIAQINAFKEYPKDFTFHRGKWRRYFGSSWVYFYTWSATEYFYI